MSFTEVIARIKELPISSVIGRYLSLRKQGAYFEALCPFHDDRRPSLMVNDQKGLFKCFPCDIGGDAISFVKKYKSLEFTETIVEIAQQFDIPTDNLFPSEQKNPDLLLAQKILKIACKIYRQCAELPRYPYFSEFSRLRNLSPTVAEDFQLGLAPSHNALTHYLHSLPAHEPKEHILSMAENIGLIKKGQLDKNQTFRYYDVFRERITFPLWDFSGNIIGLCGRALFPYQKAKYFNSKESLIFNKKNVLYGFHLARHSIKEKDCLIIVEGQMDVIAMHKMGFTHTVAVMGIALSDLCIKKLKSLTNNFILGLDSDEAGVRAMERINAQLLKNGIVAKYLNYGPYKDPDEFLENNDKQLLEQRIQQSPRFLETLMEQKMRPLLQNNGNLEQKLQCMHEIFHLIAPLEESLLASELVVQSAQSLGLQSAPAQIMTNYRSFLQEQKHRTADIRPTSANSPMVNITTEGESSFSRQHHPSQTPAPRPQHVHPPWVLGKGPRKLLQTSIIHPECLIVKEFTEIIPFIEHPPLLEVLSWLKELYYEIDEPEYSKVILDYMAKKNIPSELSDLMGSALFHYRGHNTLKEKTAVRLLKDFRAQILRDQLLSQRQQLQEKQKKCNDGQENLTIMSAINQIDKKVLEIKLNLAK